MFLLGTPLLLGTLMLATSCSTGRGTGEISGSLQGLDCGELDVPDYALEPSFFSGEVTANQLNIRIQRGSDFESFADGLSIQVRDVNDVRQNRIGLPIEIGDGPDALVEVVAYFNESCAAGFPSQYRMRPLIMEASAGTIVFESVYAPDIDAGSTGIRATLTDVVFVDRDVPELRSAQLSGDFAFFYQRGGPAQRFP
ncbi:MAG: hypothetical protein AB8I08_33295 [Sandaracinaceae bacterium]